MSKFHGISLIPGYMHVGNDNTSGHVLHTDKTKCKNCYLLSLEVARLQEQVERIQKLISTPRTF